MCLIKLCVHKTAIFNFATGGSTSVRTANPGAYHEG